MNCSFLSFFLGRLNISITLENYAFRKTISLNAINRLIPKIFQESSFHLTFSDLQRKYFELKCIREWRSTKRKNIFSLCANTTHGWN